MFGPFALFPITVRCQASLVSTACLQTSILTEEEQGGWARCVLVGDNALESLPENGQEQADGLPSPDRPAKRFNAVLQRVAVQTDGVAKPGVRECTVRGLVCAKISGPVVVVNPLEHRSPDPLRDNVLSRQ